MSSVYDDNAPPRDTRNVVDKYRDWPVEAIKHDLDTSRVELHIAIENVERDFNMGTIVRTANAFNVAVVHVIGRRQWNRRGAMVTDKYMNIVYHPTVDVFIQSVVGRQIIAVDNVPGAIPLAKTPLPKNAVLVFGSEGAGLSSELIANAQATVAIEQFGSTRSINVGVAAGIAMYTWMQQHAL